MNFKHENETINPTKTIRLLSNLAHIYYYVFIVIYKSFKKYLISINKKDVLLHIYDYSKAYFIMKCLNIKKIIVSFDVLDH